MHLFEIELWPNRALYKKAVITMIIAGIACWVGVVLATMYWDEYTYTYTTLRGAERLGGWPTLVFSWGILLGIALPAMLVLMALLMRDKQNPALALNREGIFINQQMIKATMVKWDDIAHIERGSQFGMASLAIHLKYPEAVIEAQRPVKKPFLKETLKDGKPLHCQTRNMLGDVDAFLAKAQQYKGF